MYQPDDHIEVMWTAIPAGIKANDNDELRLCFSVDTRSASFIHNEVMKQMKLTHPALGCR